MDENVIGLFGEHSFPELITTIKTGRPLSIAITGPPESPLHAENNFGN